MLPDVCGLGRYLVMAAHLERKMDEAVSKRTLLAQLEAQLPNPALEWPVALLCRAIEENSEALRQMN